MQGDQSLDIFCTGLVVWGFRSNYWLKYDFGDLSKSDSISQICMHLLNSVISTVWYNGYAC